eukprot:CAMPEP_0181450792 /NCGR_PEP_ID=MMETSP1110-20121109/28357_1 /TAXON_ID=174948 /ORGANISM="Symbiodinium sp., Strain CCMP421" /LENGTH=656 /DNA_ID=CAMNT_0023575021 /DNA_START=38 /DNA_END=2008 /DNA_ORIENTATION=+
MKVGLLCLAWLGLAAAITLQSDDAERPTTKVVKLLKTMQETVESESKADEETYDKFKCWCHENTDAKTKAAAEAETTARELKARVEELAAQSERLKGEIEKAEDEVAKNEAALDTATELRKQQNKEYMDDRERLEGDLSGVKSAQSAISSPEAGAFLQSKSGVVRPVLQQLMKDHSAKLSREDRETLNSFLQRGDGFDGVKGVLDGLVDDFSQELVTLKEDEETSLAQFTELSAAKSAEIKAGTAMVESKKGERADANEEHAQKKRAIKDTEALMGADLSFADDVNKQCAEMDAEWDERQKIRAEEAEGISKAIEILDAEDAHANFKKTFSFLQHSAKSEPEGKEAKAASAARVLAEAAHSDPRLAALAMQTKIDKFTKVKKAMDDMVFTLTKEQEDEVKQKDFCVQEFQQNEVETAEKTRLKTSLLAKEQAIDVKKPQSEMETLEGEVAEMQKQLKLAGENREKENEEFQQVVEDQRKTQKLLKDALDVLGKFYKKEALIQVHAVHAGPESPDGFKDYKANDKSFGVLSMLQKLIADSKAMEAESLRAEKSAQKAYEAFSADTTASVEKKEASVSEKKAEKARLEKSLVRTRQGREGAEDALENLANTKAGLHESCDFLMQNFEARQAARSEEMDSVKKAKAILSGATFAEIQLD